MISNGNGWVQGLSTVRSASERTGFKRRPTLVERA
jgi:hypothetical protein